MVSYIDNPFIPFIHPFFLSFILLYLLYRLLSFPCILSILKRFPVIIERLEHSFPPLAFVLSETPQPLPSLSSYAVHFSDPIYYFIPNAFRQAITHMFTRYFPIFTVHLLSHSPTLNRPWYWYRFDPRHTSLHLVDDPTSVFQKTNGKLFYAIHSGHLTSDEMFSRFKLHFLKFIVLSCTTNLSSTISFYLRFTSIHLCFFFGFCGISFIFSSASETFHWHHLLSSLSFILKFISILILIYSTLFIFIIQYYLSNLLSTSLSDANDANIHLPSQVSFALSNYSLTDHLDKISKTIEIFILVYTIIFTFIVG